MNQRTHRDQHGLVSIMIASVLMVIMALITLGFTRLVQNEQRQALDDQLSRQAFYAAESGINLAVSTDGYLDMRKDDCNNVLNGGIIDEETPEVTFTCLLIEPEPEDLVFSNDAIKTNRSKVVPIQTGQNISSFTIEWYDANSSTVDQSCDLNPPAFTNSADWDKVSLLRLELVPIPNGDFDREFLLDNQASFILYPCSEADGTSDVALSNNTGSSGGGVVGANCEQEAPYVCQITIITIDADIGSHNNYYMKLSSIYNNLNVRITAMDVANNLLRFAGTQAVVDSTGRANDVFRRIQARVPLYDMHTYPTATLQTVDDICKRYVIMQEEVVSECSEGTTGTTGSGGASPVAP